MCAGTCPHGDVMEYPPRKIINLLKNGMVTEVLTSTDILYCVSCYHCTTKCPRGIKLTQILLPIIKENVIESLEDVPEELQKALENALRYGNPMGESPRRRSNWVKNLDVPIRDLSDEPPSDPVDVLWWVESYNSYHPRNIETSIDTVKLLKALEVDFAILGNEEWWAGDCVRLSGEVGLFEEQTEINMKTLNKYPFNKLVVSDPHAYDAFKYQYPCYGFKFEIEHIAPFISTYSEKIKPLLTKTLDYKVTYHDSCCLGRHNGFYEGPRELLNSISGIKLVEMIHNRQHSLCCGGGGGGMWLDSYYMQKGVERLSDRRIKEAIDTGADVIAVSCPYEISRFEDSIKVLGYEGNMIVKDVIELLVEAMG
jgi:Fe-S oxidoreductase